MSARPYTFPAEAIVAGFLCDATNTRQNLEANQSTMHSALDRDAWLAALERIAAARASIRAVIESFAEPGKAQALENLVYLEVTNQSDSDEPTPGKKAAE